MYNLKTTCACLLLHTCYDKINNAKCVCVCVFVCTCLLTAIFMYSLGEGCSHVAAVLFKVEAAVRNGYTSVKCPTAFNTPVLLLPIRQKISTSSLTMKELSSSHEHTNTFFQVQGQMAVFEHKYTYFVCWTPQGLHLEQIEQDQQFFSSIERTLDYFFLNVILPAFLGGECTENQCQSPSSKKQKPL